MKKANLKKAGLVGAFAMVVMGLAQVAGADPVGGPKWDVDVAPAFGSVTYTIDLHGGEATLITLDGDGDSDLDLYVYDEFGNLIASDTGMSDYASAIVVPRWTGAFTIRVVNRGVANLYRLEAT